MTPDEQARHEAEHNLDQHIFLSAGAGTGKTTVLVRRYMQLLRTRKATVPEIVCVTFTEKAAGELKTRIRAGCDEETQSDPAEARTWARHKRQLENAPITTIHGFCARLIRQFTLVAGIDPKFNVIDDRESTLLREEVARSFVLNRLRLGDCACLEKLATFLGIEKLYDLVKKLLTMPRLCETQPARSKQDEAQSRQAWAEALDSCREREIESLVNDAEWLDALDVLREHHPENDRSAAAEKHRNVLSLTGKLASPGLSLNEKADLIKNIRLSLNRMAVGKWTDLEAARGAVKGLKDLINGMATLHCDPEVEELALELSLALQAELSLAQEAFRTEKRAASALDFDDLLAEAHRLVHDFPEVCRRSRSEVKAFLIDEFQDTDQVQKEVLWGLAGMDCAPGEGPGPNVFVVGDAKQSIYRFRGADVSVFNATRKEFLARDDCLALELSRNFRTHDRLMVAFNDLFLAECVMGPEEGKELYEAGYSRLEASRTRAGAGPWVELLLATPEEDKALIEDLRIHEAEMIAARIRSLVEQQPFEIECRTADAEPAIEPLKWGHFAMLFRAMSDVALYERALRHQHIPYYLVAGRGLFARQEVRDLLNFLRALQNRRNEVALAGLLRSPMFGASDEALYWLSREHSLPDALSTLGPGQPESRRSRALERVAEDEIEKLERAEQCLRHFRRIKDRLSLSGLLEAFLTETGLTAALLTTYGGAQKVSNLRKLVEMARGFEKSGTLSLEDFLHIVENLVVREEREGEAPTDEEESNVVKLLTVHKAKGLEWPVVIVPDMARSLRGAHGQNFFLLPDWGPVLKGETVAGKSEWPAICRWLQKEERDKETAESRRLLYVALTRARDYLVLSGSFGSGGPKAESWQNWMLAAFGGEVNPGRSELATLFDSEWKVRTWQSSLNEDLATGSPRTESRESAGDSLPASHDKLRKQLQRFEPDTRTRNRFTVTELEEYTECPQRFYLKRVRDWAEFFPGGGAGFASGLSPTVRGTIIHRAIELLVQKPSRDLGEALGLCFEEQGIHSQLRDQSIDGIRSAIDKFLAQDVWKALSGAKKVDTEAPFALRFENAAIEGAIDALAETESGEQVLFDFKTGHTPASHYEFQVGVYCLAVEALFGAPPARAALYYVDTGETKNLDLSRILQETRSRLKEALQGIRQSEFDRTPEAECAKCGMAWTCKQKE